MLGQFGSPSGSVRVPPYKTGNWLASISSSIAGNHSLLSWPNIFILFMVAWCMNGLSTLNTIVYNFGAAINITVIALCFDSCNWITVDDIGFSHDFRIVSFEHVNHFPRSVHCCWEIRSEKAHLKSITLLLGLYATWRIESSSISKMKVTFDIFFPLCLLCSARSLFIFSIIQIKYRVTSRLTTLAWIPENTVKLFVTRHLLSWIVEKPLASILPWAVTQTKTYKVKLTQGDFRCYSYHQGSQICRSQLFQWSNISP